MSDINPTTIGFLIVLLGPGLAATGWGEDSRSMLADEPGSRRRG
jgi:hypothetical protein